MRVICWIVSAVVKVQLSMKFGLDNHIIHSRIAVSNELAGGRDRHHSVIIDVAFSLHIMLIMTHLINVPYPLLGDDFCLWFSNNRDIWTRISRLMSSAWGIKRKERRWRHHNGNSGRRLLSLPQQCDQIRLFIRRFRTYWLGSYNFKSAEMFHTFTNIVWAWDKFVTPCFPPWIREFIHTWHRKNT